MGFKNLLVGLATADKAAWHLSMSSSVAKMPSVADQLLIEEVRLHECLYAVTTKSNKDNQSRDEAWRSISKTLGKSGK